VAVVLVDTGPLVAFFRASELHHEWAKTQFAALDRPLLTCEPVVTEAAYLLSEHGSRPELLWELFRRSLLQIAFDLESEVERIDMLMRRYANVPMDLADACLVRMSELNRQSTVVTTDSDFDFYRRFGRQSIPTIQPDRT
jgi:predicted nucleic acid-binding protein